MPAAPMAISSLSQAFSSPEKPPSTADRLQSLSTSPRQFPNEFTSPILEEGGESESESPNEPTTPVSGRTSQDFHVSNHDTHAPGLASAANHPQDTQDPQASLTAATAVAKPPLLINTAPTPTPTPKQQQQSKELPPLPTSAVIDDDEEEAIGKLPNISRRSTSTSLHTIRRSVSNMFRRSNSQTNKQDFVLTNGEPLTHGAASDTNLKGANGTHSAAAKNSRRFSMNKSSTTTRSNTPPSPGSPLEMAATSKHGPTVPTTEDFDSKKKNRASTGLLGRRGIAFVNGSNNKPKRPSTFRAPRRASSFDSAKNVYPQNSAANDENNPAIPIDRLPWAMPAETGTGIKARRMSLSLPDDFTVDVAELLNEFEYQHKFLGRHGKGLGRGATCKVTLMTRKGSPGELYAVKEFRSKSRAETPEEYEKKVKSEYSLAKSLHHPNIVETVRLCIDHGRWNHVMEYCSEGDLFSLVQKGYLKGPARLDDRACLFKQLCQGISYLHANGIAHRDIKLENLLLTQDSKLKITDFGVSEVFCGIHPGLREAGGQCGKGMGQIRLCEPGVCGSEPYIAPEVLSKQGPYDPRPMDVWGSAIIMIYLTFGGAIWERAAKGQPNYDALIKSWNKWNDKHPDANLDELQITESDYPVYMPFDSFVNPPGLRRVLLQMLHPIPSRRITMAEVLNQRWMKATECCQLESYEDPSKLIDASKKASMVGAKKYFCHNHLPPKEHKIGMTMPQYS